MAKRYLCKDGGGTFTLPASTQSSGAQVHLLNFGPSLGLQFNYSGVVTGTGVPPFYRVDNGPSLGEQETVS